jgi:hypothetical protein
MHREEIKEIVRKVMIEMFVPVLNLEQADPGEDWVDLRNAWKPLGYPSYSALYKAVQSGLLREGKELCDRRKPGAQIARWQVDLIAARKRLRQDSSKRRAV